MKKISILLIAILFLFVTNVSAEIIPAEKENWNTFVDEKSGLMIDFPASFEVIKRANHRDIILKNNLYSIFILTSFLITNDNLP